ncbi:MAG: hypothetical protein IPI11_05070 [Haliscomenobacter sp.]|nr:hypothetical protein [Haliscomenobacter sp.]
MKKIAHLQQELLQEVRSQARLEMDSILAMDPKRYQRTAARIINRWYALLENRNNVFAGYKPGEAPMTVQKFHTFLLHDFSQKVKRDFRVFYGLAAKLEMLGLNDLFSTFFIRNVMLENDNIASGLTHSLPASTFREAFQAMEGPFRKWGVQKKAMQTLLIQPSEHIKDINVKVLAPGDAQYPDPIILTPSNTPEKWKIVIPESVPVEKDFPDFQVNIQTGFSYFIVNFAHSIEKMLDRIVRMETQSGIFTPDGRPVINFHVIQPDAEFWHAPGAGEVCLQTGTSGAVCMGAVAQLDPLSAIGACYGAIKNGWDFGGVAGREVWNWFHDLEKDVEDPVTSIRARHFVCPTKQLFAERQKREPVADPDHY